MKRRQRGITFMGLMFSAVGLILVGILGAQVVPSWFEYRTILKAANHAATGQTVAEVRSLFDKAASVDYFAAVKSKDLEISKENDKVVVSFEYEREFHLVGPAWLVMRYSGRSE